MCVQEVKKHILSFQILGKETKLKAGGVGKQREDSQTFSQIKSIDLLGFLLIHKDLEE